MWEGRKEGPCTASRRGTGELRWGDGLRPCRGRGFADGVLWWGITLGFRSHPMLASDPEKIEAAHPTLESTNQVKKETMQMRG